MWAAAINFAGDDFDKEWVCSIEVTVTSCWLSDETSSINVTFKGEGVEASEIHWTPV